MRAVTAIITLASALCLAAPARADIDCYRNKSEACKQTKARPLPTSIDEFLALRDEIGKSPRGGATLFVYALLVRQIDAELGEAMLVLSLAEDKLVNGSGGYKGYALAGADKQKLGLADRQAHCVRSYVSGSSPDNAYAIDRDKVALRFRDQTKYVGTIASGKYKVFVCSTGTDSCRPITTRRNKRGFWKVAEYSSLVTGCRKPAATDAAADEAADAL